MSGSGGSGDKPPSVDQDGKMINPHNPEFITKVPWYLGDSGPTLKHHSIQNKSHELSITETDQLIAKKLAAQSEILQASKRTTYRKGACKNCGAMTHQEKDCLERPRSSKKMAWKSGLDIAADEVVLDLAQHGKLSYSAKRDQWKGFDPSEYQEIVERHNRLEDERRKLVEAEQQAKQRALEAEAEAQRHARAARKAAKAERAARRQANEASGAAVSDSDESDDYSDASDSDADGDGADRRRALDAAHPDDGVKASDANTRDFQGTLIPQGGVGGNGMRITSRNLRIREDTPKYLRNLSLDSAFYDPKSRSMRANPYGNVANPDDLAFAGDNFVRYSGDAVELAKNQVLCWEMVEKGAMPEALAELGGAGMIDVIANPSQAEYLKRQFELKKAEVQAAKKRALYAKYLGTDDDAPPADSAATATSASAGSSGASSSGGSSGSAQAPKALDIRLRLGQTEAYVEYDRDGRVVKGPGATSKGGAPLVSAMTKYEEDAFPLNHTSVWGSYYSRARACWGYACCHSTLKNAYCIGAAGREANDAAMRQESQLAVRKQAKEDERQGSGAGRRGAVPLFDADATATTEPPAISDRDKSKWAALTQRFDGGAGSGGKGSSNSSAGAKGGNEDDADGGKKRPLLGFGSGAAVDVSEADLEEFRRKRVKHEDPMAAFLDQPDVLLDR